MLKKEIVKKDNKIKVTFIVPGEVGSSAVLGDFNQWNATRNPLQKRSNGTRSASILLEPNQSYAFRYYTQDGAWFNDEAADGYEVNEHGSKNCIVITS